jgi:endoglucanase
MGTLMSAYEDFKTWFDTLKLNIPESRNSQADLLDEVEYNLRWMLTMQDPGDGGVYHKCTNAAFDGNVMPGATKLPRYVVQKSTAAALDFAAVMAQAARVYKISGGKQKSAAASDKTRKTANLRVTGDDLSTICLSAAKKAWDWAMANPAVLYNQDSINKIHQPAITTGAYGDRSLTDAWFWAACELFITTGDASFVARLKEKSDSPVTLPGWPSVRTMGIYSVIRHQQTINSFKKPETASIIAAFKAELVKRADEYVSLRASNKLLTVMGSRKSDFNWGSNSNAANQGMLLINAWKLTGKQQMLDAAMSNLDYLCGRNSTGYCFVTGFGTVSPMHPHHRPSVADKVDAPVPGLLAGGPNGGMQDKCSYRFTEPELAYTDDFCSYASNEIAINWNAPLVYLVNAVEAINSGKYPRPAVQ